MKKYNNFLYVFLALTLIFSTPGLSNLVINAHASVNINDIISGYLDGAPSSPGNIGNSWPWPLSNSDPAPAAATPAATPTPSLNPSQQMAPGCIQDKVTRIGASGQDGNNVPQNVLDNKFNTRWSDYGKGSNIQIDLGKKDTLCAVEIAWHRGDVRINDFMISTSTDGITFTPLFTGKSSGDTNSYEPYVVNDPNLTAQYIKVTVNGNTENDWASISEIRAFSKPASQSPGPGPGPGPNPGQLPAGCIQDKVTRIGANGDDGNRPQNVIDNNFNTRWSNYGSGSNIQIDLGKKDKLCAVDIAWHRGDVRTNDFVLSTSTDGTTFTTLYDGESSGETNSHERYLIQDSNLTAQYIKVTVNGNTENDWASISEIRAFSKPASQSPGPDPDPDPDPDPNPGPSNGTDVFGVKKIYKDKPNGEKWFMNMVNPSSDNRFDPKLTLKKNADGSYKVTSDKVRMNVFTGTGYHQGDIDTYDQKSLSAKGYMQAVNDWRNLEITGYIKINSASDSDFDLSWYAHGGKHNSDVPCEGTSYKGGLFKDGRSRFAKEQWHSGGYSFTPAQKNIDSIVGKWVGFKTVMFNTVVNGEPAVKLENWVDESNNGQWKKVFGYTDSGGFGEDGDRCGGSPDQQISWGGPIVTFRWDGTSNVDIKNLSVREIAAN